MKPRRKYIILAVTIVTASASGYAQTNVKRLFIAHNDKKHNEKIYAIAPNGNSSGSQEGGGSGSIQVQIFDDQDPLPKSKTATDSQAQPSQKTVNASTGSAGEGATSSSSSSSQESEDIIDDDPTQNDPDPVAKPKSKKAVSKVQRPKKPYRYRPNRRTKPHKSAAKKNPPLKLHEAVQKLGTDILEWQRQKEEARKKKATPETKQLGPTPPSPPASPTVNVRGEPVPENSNGNPAADTVSKQGNEPEDPAGPETAPGDRSPEKTEGGFRLPVTITLGSSQNLQGYMDGLQPGNLTISHKHKGLLFKKEFRWQDIERINILKWSSTKVRETPQGTLYSYRPAKIQVRLKNGEVLYFDNMPRPLMEFRFVHTGYGQTRLFTHFADVQLKDGRWRERPERIDPETTPHPQAVTKILFAQ